MKKEKKKLFFSYSLRYQMKNKKAFLFNIVTIAVGIAVFLCIQSVIAVSRNNISKASYVKTGGDTAVVFSEHKVGADLLEELNSLESTDKLNFTKTIWLQGSVSAQKRNSMCVVRYIDPEQYPYYKLKSDPCDYRKLLSKETIIISSRLASSLHVSIGDNVKIQGFDNNSSNYTVVGIAPEDGEESLDMNIYGYVFMNIHCLEQDIGENLENIASKIYIKTNKNTIQGLEREFPEENFQTVREEEEALTKENKGMSDSYSGMGILALVIAFVGIISSMILMVMKRQKDICILKVYGATNFEIGKLFLKEILFVTFLGVILGEVTGMVLSIALCKMFYGYFINLLEMNGFLMILCKVFLIGIVTGGIFGIFPILVTMQFKPISILRERMLSKADLRKRSFILCGIVLFIMLGSVFSLLVKGVVGYVIVSAVFIIICIIFLFALFLLKCVTTLGIIGKSSVKKIALKSMRKDNKKFALVELTMSVCVAVIGMVLLMYNSIFPSLEKQVKNSLGYDVLFKIESSRKDEMDKVLKSVKVEDYYTSTIIDFKVAGVNGKKTKNLDEYSYSIDCMHDNLSYVNDSIITGQGIGQNSNKNEIVLDEDFFNQYGLKINDTITLQIGSEYYDFIISGVRKSNKIKTGQAYIDFDVIKRYTDIMGNQNVIRYYIVCKDADNFIGQLNEKFDDIVALNMKDISAPYAATLNKNMQMLKVVSILCILSAVFLVFNILSITYMGKMKEFLILGLFGAESNSKRKIVLIQGLFLGIASAILSFFVSIFGALVLEVLTGISVNYDVITFLEIVGMAMMGSMTSAVLLSKNLVHCKEYGILRTE